MPRDPSALAALTIVSWLALGCGGTTLSTLAFDAPRPPIAASVRVHPDGTPQPAGMHVLAVFVVDGTDSLTNDDAMIRRMVEEAPRVGCTDLVVRIDPRPRRLPRAIGLCGVAQE